MMEVYTFSAKGRRKNNEDYVLSCQFSSDCSIHLLADGMGGYKFGEIAAALACETIAGYLQANLAKSDALNLLKQSVIKANAMVLKKRQELVTKMGTTIAGVLIEDSKAYVFWLGDVRVYHFRKKKLLFQSEDHSLIAEMKKQGTVTIKEIERYGNIVTKSVSGSDFEGDFPTETLSLMPGDMILLCSDGFWRNTDISFIINLTEKEIADQLKMQEEDMDDNYSLLKIIV